MTMRFEARESAGVSEIWTIGANGNPVDISGWSFSAAFQKQAGSTLFTLATLDTYNTANQGFFVYDGPKGQLYVRILPATLAGIADTTGDFRIFGDLLATPPSLPQQFVKAIEGRITTAGPWP